MLQAVKQSGHASFGVPGRVVAMTTADISYNDAAINSRCYGSSSSNLFMYIIALLSFSVITHALHYIPLTSSSVYKAKCTLLWQSPSNCLYVYVSLCLSVSV